MGRAVCAIMIFIAIILHVEGWGQQHLSYENSILWNSPIGMSVSAEYAYCAFPYGLAIYDVSNPGNPVETGRISFGKTLTDFDVSGNYAYVAAESLNVVNLSNPSNPVLIGQYSSQFLPIHAVSVNANYAFALSGALVVFDISNPFNLVNLGESWLGIDYIFAGDYYLYAIADFENELKVIDISNPSDPVIVGTDSVNNYSYNIFAADERVYVTDYIWGLQVFSVENAGDPHFLGLGRITDGAAAGVCAEGGYAYVATGFGLEIFDVSGGEPDPFLSFQTALPSIEIYKSANSIFTTAMTGFEITDASDLLHPRAVGQHVTPACIDYVDAQGEYAYLSSIYGGLQIINFSDSSNPVIMGSLGITGSSLDIDVQGHYAYIATSIQQAGVLNIVDISNPQNPIWIGSCNLPPYPAAISVQDSFAYMAELQSGIRVVDISNPTLPVIVAQYDTGFGAYGILAYDNYLFIGNCWDGLLILDISNPREPAYLSQCSLSGCARGIAISGNYAFVACTNNGPFEVIDISDISRPVRVASYNYTCSKILIDNNFALVAGGDIGLIDISDPHAPRLLNTFNTLGPASDIAKVGDLYIIADNSACLMLKMNPTGISVPPVFAPQDFSLFPAYPNPFNALTTIRYDLPLSSNVSIEIFDIIGRKIRTIQKAYLEAGRHSIVWNAEDEPSGIYFYVIKAGEYAKTGKCILMK